MRVQTTLVALTLLTNPLTIKNVNAAAVPPFSGVNMKDASFQQFVYDGIVSRIYSSRSLHIGVFGFGWCSNIETQYEADCPEPINKLKTTLDAKGRVATLVSQSGVEWRVQYDSDSKIRLMSSPKQELRYDYKNQDLVGVYRSFTGKKSGRISYEIQIEKYEYDELHNLVEANNESKRLQLRYDSDRDSVLEYRRADGCIERFLYERTDSVSGPKETAAAKVQCGKKIESVTFEFFYHQQADGVRLAKVRSTAGDLIKTISLERGI